MCMWTGSSIAPNSSGLSARLQDGHIHHTARHCQLGWAEPSRPHAPQCSSWRLLLVHASTSGKVKQSEHPSPASTPRAIFQQCVLVQALGQQLLKQLQAKGLNPIIVPVGGSNALGTWGYINAVQELAQQHKQWPFTDIVMVHACPDRSEPRPPLAVLAYIRPAKEAAVARP